LHDINYAAHHADRVVLMKRAGVVAELPAKEIMNKALLEQIYETPFAIMRQGKKTYAIPTN
jgi:iron complex transport system ATP-binding protein